MSITLQTEYLFILTVYHILIKIKEHISKGNTYEVNYTYPYKVYTNTDSLTLYNYLLQKQTTEYNTYIANEWEELLSFSPELFFKLDGNKITTKPMKGTAARGKTEEEDAANYNFLKNDIKNQAENVMIVDLLRNDLSKIAQTGTVKVDKLFEIEKHPTVYQMTSEISAELEEGTSLFDIFNASAEKYFPVFIPYSLIFSSVNPHIRELLFLSQNS